MRAYRTSLSQSLRVKLCSVGIGSAHLYHWLALQRHITANATEELKIDGFRALAHVEAGQAQLISRNGNVFRGFFEVEPKTCPLGGTFWAALYNGYTEALQCSSVSLAQRGAANQLTVP